MKLHVFNPEHDLALGNGTALYCAPKTARRMAKELSWLPSLWSDDKDEILTNWDFPIKSNEFVEEVLPWGWDAAIRYRLLKYGIPEEVLPTVATIEKIRQGSSRKTAVCCLKKLTLTKNELLCGESWWCETLEQIEMIGGRLVLKAPWSSSGKGLLFVDGELTETQRGWCRNVLKRQGGIAVERFFNKMHDFALEYEITREHEVHYLGLSLFDNNPMGAYCGNLLCTETYKLAVLGIDEQRLQTLVDMQSEFLRHEFAQYYHGPIGIDMMTCYPVEEKKAMQNHVQPLINPCVEINLRRTMGHVALALERHIQPVVPMHFIVGFDKTSGYFARIEE